MNAQISEANPDDSEFLSALAVRTYTEAFGHSMNASDLAAHIETNLSPERFREVLREDAFLLARVGGKTVGFVQFGDAHIDDRDLDGLKVRPGDKEVRRLYVLGGVSEPWSRYEPYERGAERLPDCRDNRLFGCVGRQRRCPATL